MCGAASSAVRWMNYAACAGRSIAACCAACYGAQRKQAPRHASYARACNSNAASVTIAPTMSSTGRP